VSKKLIKTILLVEDNPGDARLLRDMLNEEGLHDTELPLAARMAEAEKYLADHAVDTILLDLGLPDAQGLGAVRRARAAAPGVPLVVLTGLDDETLAAQALQEGAQDYLVKGQIEARGLLRVLRYAVERKRLERLKDEFIATVSHELRTPLTSICASLGLLMGKAAGNLPDPAARLLAIAHTNSQRLVRLINDILDIEKMDSGQVVFNLGRVEVRTLVKQTIEANREFAEGYGVRIRLDDACVVGEVRADPDRLAQVVTNLLSNAIKFSPANDELVIAVEKGTELSVLQAGHERPGRGAANHRGGSAACVGTAGIRAALPAEDQSGHRSDLRGRSIDTLDSSHAGIGSSGTVYSHRGSLRPHSADRCLGHARSLQASPDLGRCRPACGISLS
jgi:signal transduction histidine kinase